MKAYSINTILFVSITFLLACEKKSEPEKVFIPDIVMSYLAPAGLGSYYIYKDNFTQEIDTFRLDYFSERFNTGFVGLEPFCSDSRSLQSIRYDLINTQNQNDIYRVAFSTTCNADSIGGTLSKGPASDAILNRNSINDIFYNNDTINSFGMLVYMQDTLQLEIFLFIDVLVFNVDITAGSLRDLYFAKDIGLVKANRLEVIDYNIKP